mgnify:CR=1 FL=1
MVKYVETWMVLLQIIMFMLRVVVIMIVRKKGKANRYVAATDR